MKGKLVIVILLLFVFGCKVKPKNSEPNLRFYFVAVKKESKKNFCFDEVKGKSNKSLPSCIDSLNNFLDIPLNLNENTANIIFIKNKKSDTLSLEYSISVAYSNDEYEAEIYNLRIVHTNFDSTSVSQRNSKSLNTNVKESISIYY